MPHPPFSSRTRDAVAICVALVLAGTALPPPLSAAPWTGDAWWVYQDDGSPDNHGFWSNVVPANAGGMLHLDLANRSKPASGTTAIRIDMTFAPGAGWCGVAVASAPGYWGERPGDGFDLSAARSLAFRARGDQGGERIRVKAAVAGDQPFGDAAPLPLDSGWLELSAEWRDYRVSTDGYDLSRVITPFMVIANDKHNPAGRLTIFLDDVRFEVGG